MVSQACRIAGTRLVNRQLTESGRKRMLVSTAIAFKEYGMVVLPGYQFGGMEHPGAIQMNDRRIFLEKNATQEEKAARLELIAHETAHLWFGDLVSL